MSTKLSCSLAVLLFSSQLLGQMGGYFGPQLTPPPVASKLEDRCVLQGHVTNSLTGEPLKKAAIRLEKRGGDPQSPQGYSTTSEPDGSFKIENIEPGTYYLSGSRTGYLNTRYGAKSFGQPGTSIVLAKAQQMTDVTLALIPQAVISGKVLDQDGDPVPNTLVNVVAQMWQRGKLRYAMQGGNSTNDLGEYRIANVRPGKYYLVVQRHGFMPNEEGNTEPGKPDIRPVKTFYPSAPSVSTATPLDVKAGQDLTGMDIRMLTAATYHIRGKVVGNLPEGANNLNVNASVLDDSDSMMFMFGGGANVTKDRTFDIAGVVPGSYTLNLFSVNGQPKSLGHQDVAVGEADLNDVQLAIVPPQSLHGQILLTGNPPAGKAHANLTNVHLFLYGADNLNMMFGNGNTVPKDDGSFTIENVAAGKYYLNANTPAGTYLKSLRFGSQELLGKALDTSQGTAQLTLTFSYGVAEVAGIIQQPDSSSTQAGAKPDMQVVLLPEVMNDDGSGLRFGNSNPDGSFSLKQVPPGQYRAYAFEQINLQQLQNPDFVKEIESKGVAVELKENDKKQVQLTLITEDEVNQIYTRLGIDVP